MEKLLTQGKLPLAQIKPRGRLLRAAAGRWEEQKPGRKGEAMCFQTGRLRGQNILGPDHGVTSLERARRPPFQDAQCGCAPRAHQGRGATGFPRLPSSPDPPIPQRLVAVPRDQLPLPSLQGLPGKTGIPAIPRSPAPAPRVPQSRGWALPPGWDSSAVLCIEEGRKEEGRRGGKRGEGGEGNQRNVAAALAVFSTKVKDTPFFGRDASKSWLCNAPSHSHRQVGCSIRDPPGPLHQLLCGRECGAFLAQGASQPRF